MRLVALLLSVTLLAGCASSPPPTLMPAEAAALSEVVTIGRQIYKKDIHAAKATDLLLAEIDPRVPGFRGWVTYPTQGGIKVSFYREQADSYVVMADVEFVDNAEPALLLDPPRQPSEMEQSMVRARLAALSVGTNSCSQRFNTVVLPSRQSEPWDVYVLAATTQRNLVQLGGHSRIVVSKESAEVLDQEPFSKSCLALDKSAGDSATTQTPP